MDQKELWLLQLIRYFLFHKQYAQVKFVNAANGEISSDTWLANPDSSFPVIHISMVSPQESAMQEELINRQSLSLQNILGKKGKIVDVYLDTKPFYQENEDHVQFSIYPNAQLPESLLRNFNGLNSVVFNVENPGAEMQKLTSAINQYALEHNNPNARSKRQFLNSFSTTFKVAGGICAALFIAVSLISIIGKYNSTSVGIFLGAYYKEFITVLHQYWRVLTGGFIHISLLHLWVNLTSLYNISKVVEDKFGFVKTFIILIVSIIVGNICVYAGDQNIVAVGISGGIYGLFAAMIIIYWKDGYFKVPVLRNRLLSNIYVNILINFLPYVSFLAHLGGFVAGLFLAFIFLDYDKSIKINFTVAGCAIVIALGILSYNNRDLDKMYLGTDKEVVQLIKNVGMESAADKMNVKINEYYLKEFN